MYHNKVNLSLTPVKRFGNQAHNCKMDCCETKSYVKPSTELDSENLMLENTIDDFNDDNQPSENKTPNKNRKRTKARVIGSVWLINKVILGKIIVNLLFSLLLGKMKKTTYYGITLPIKSITSY